MNKLNKKNDVSESNLDEIKIRLCLISLIQHMHDVRRIIQVIYIKISIPPLSKSPQKQNVEKINIIINYS